MKSTLTINGFAKAVVLAATVLVFTGCPEDLDLEYERGFIEGFMEDDEYWLGYSDSYHTVPDGPILYSGSEIPYIESPPYDNGYWDGVWYAYNDGYFVCYDYGFTIGFSEGYDLAFRSDWYGFLVDDAHPEYLDGSFADGYNDGFTEGSIFGASDYLEGLPFDWLDALWDYRDGTDLYIEELGRGTGEYGPVYLYIYGEDPNDYYDKSATPSGVSQIRRPRPGAVKSGRAPSARILHAVPNASLKDAAPQYDPDEISHRVFTEEARNHLNIAPAHSERGADRELILTDTWLDRVNAYRESFVE